MFPTKNKSFVSWANDSYSYLFGIGQKNTCGTSKEQREPLAAYRKLDNLIAADLWFSTKLPLFVKSNSHY